MRLADRRSYIEVSKYFIILQLVVIKFWLPTTLDSQGGEGGGYSKMERNFREGNKRRGNDRERRTKGKEEK